MQCLGAPFFLLIIMQTLLFTLLFCILTSVHAIEGIPSSKWVELNDTTFSSALASHDEWMICFFANWCSACHGFMPILEDVSQRAIHSRAQFAKIDIEASPGLAAQFHIRRIPLLFHIKGHQVRAYEGSRTSQSIVSYLEQNKWANDKPIPSYLSPLSLFGRLLFFLGRFSGFIIKNLGQIHRQLHPFYGILAITMIAVLITYIFGSSLLGNQLRRTYRRSQAAKSNSTPQSVSQGSSSPNIPSEAARSDVPIENK
jgi:thiol-disulfide isomerase/thioredoxin